MRRLIDADKYMEHLRAEINSEADIIAKYIKEDDPIGTVKDCGRIGRLQGLQWNRNMLESDRFTVEAIPKTDLKIILNRLKVRMKDRDEDNGGEPLNAVDRGYHLAYENLCEEIDNLLKETENGNID